jgi:aspartate/methionine/tyrosine aminotransferase
MKLYPFALERWQSTYENQVEYNLAESGVDPLRLDEILDGEAADLLAQKLGYSQTNGTQELRNLISGLYSGSTEDDILVTNGSSEAILVSLLSFLDRGAEVAVMCPNYMSTWGLAKMFRAKVRSFWLRERQGRWALDTAGLRKAVSKRTRLIAICNPNNPTGAVLNEDEVGQICEIAEKVGAWVLSDEAYRGAELNGKETPSLWGRYRKTIVTSGLSKAYALPGLRIGWVAAKGHAGKLWAYHDYTTIGPGAISDFLARRTLQPEKRARILARTRSLLQANLPIITSWVERQQDYLSFIAPKAGAISYVKYSLRISSMKLAKRLLTEKNTLVVPGQHFHMGRYLRIGYGGTREHLEAGLQRIGEMFASLQAMSAV